jgi:hypothetical protein
MDCAALRIEPLAVWDARADGYHKWPHWQEAESWLHERGIIGFLPDEPRSRTYRAEIWLIDAPFARCWRYGLTAVVGGHVVMKDPEDIPLSELPPARLLGLKSGDYWTRDA